MVAVLTIPLVVALTIASLATADDWSRFRGPNGSGVATDARLPIEFGPERNVVWKTSLPFGHSSPVLSADRIYVTALRGADLVTIAVDRASGKILWERVAPRARHEKLDNRNGPAAPSAAADGSNVFVFFADFGLLSYDSKGRERWRVPLGPFDNIYGMGASPVVVDDVVVLVCDQSTSSYIAAFDKRSGALRWKTSRPEAHSGHSTPIVYRPAGTRENQIIVPGSFRLSAYSVTSGERIWWVGGLAFELKSTPVVQGDVLFINGFGSPENQPGAQRTIPTYQEALTRYDADKDARLQRIELPAEHGRSWIDLNGDGTVVADEWDYYRAAMASENGMLAIRLGGRGDVTATNVVWKYHRSVPQLPSPLVFKDVLYMAHDGGIVTTLRTATGEVIAQSRVEGASDRIYASPVADAANVFLATESGKIAVLPTDGSLRPLAVNDLREDIYATPAIAGGRLYVRTRGTLYCFGR